MRMQKKLQQVKVITSCLEEFSFQHFLLKMIDLLLPKRIGLGVITLLISFFSISSYSQLATESFEAGMPATWTQVQNIGGTTPWTTINDGYLGGNAAYVNPALDDIGQGNTAQYYMVTPQLTVPSNGEIRFYTKQGSIVDNGTIYEVKISTASQPDIAGFNVTLQSWTETTLNVGSATNYEEKIIQIPGSIPVGLNVYIAFVAVNTQTGVAPSGDSWYVDNVRVIEGCQQVVQPNFTASNLTSNSATLSWTHPTATDFEIQVLPQGTSPGTTGISTLNSFNASFLSELTTYDVYIKTICDASTASAWAGPFTFTTRLAGTICSDPIVLTPDLPTPYQLTSNLNLYQNPAASYTDEGSGCLPATINGNYLAGSKIFFSYTANSTGLLTVTQNALGQVAGNAALGSGCFNNVSTGFFIYDDCAAVGNSCLAGNFTNTANVPTQIPNFFVQAGETYLIVLSTNLSPTASICFTFNVEFSTCAPPSHFTYDSLLQTSVNFSWNNVGSLVNDWEYIALPVADGTPIGAGIPTSSNVNNSLTNLLPGTTYNLYVRSVCGGIPGNWSLPYKFTTQCNVIIPPHTESFTGATATTPTPCWTSLDVNNDGRIWSYLSPGYATLQTNTFQNNNHDYLVSPQFDFNDGVQKRIRYKHQSVGGTSVYSIKLSSTGIGESNFTDVILAPITVATSTTFQDQIINLPAGITGNVNFAFIVEPGSGQTATRISIDDFIVEDKPACSNPIAPTVTISSITTTSAELSWTFGDTETQWEVAIQPLNSGLPTGSGVLVSSNPYLAENLNPATRYEYYVRAYCTSVFQSEWVGPIAFTTLCDTFNTPYFESFNDDDINTKKFCWSTNNANADGVQWNITPTEANIQRAAFMGANEYDDWLISPAINAVGNKKLSFKYRALAAPFYAARHAVQVLISTTDTNPSSFTEISPVFEFNNTDYLEKEVFFTGSGTIYIAFRVPPGVTSPQTLGRMNIDDVLIEDAPPCPNPSELVVSAIGQSTATISWLQGYAETSWDIAIQPTGSGVPTSGTSFNNTTFNATSLAPNTVYEVYIRATCGSDGNSQWVGPVSFRTLCLAIPSPFVETFNSDSPTEECWRVVDANDDGDEWQMNVTVNPYEGDQMAGMFTGNNGQNDDWLISPTITITANQRIRYYYKVYDSFFTEDLKIKLSTNGIELAEFTTTLYDSSTDPVIINNTEYKEKIINIPAGITGDINVAFQVPFYASTGSYRGQLLFIDNFTIEDIPACPQPSNVTTQNIIDTEVQISWEVNGTETEWEVSMQPFGTPAPVGNTNPSYLHTVVTSPTTTISGLTPATKYEYYVRAICDTSTQSEWVGPFEFITRCSFDDLCEYTITLDNGSPNRPGGSIDLIQNGVIVQAMQFPTGPFGVTPPPAVYTVFLCNGVDFSLFWNSIGTAPNQFPNAQVTVTNSSGIVVYTSPLGLGTPRRIMYTGTALCGTVACPQPTNLMVSNQNVFTWTAGGSETQWEVFIQPIGNNTLPQSGTIVSSPTYTPVASDFSDLSATTYEYFVRAICDSNNSSFWSGPKAFIRNDEANTSITLAVNTTNNCEISGTNVSFIGATVSPEPLSTCGGVNGGDIWYDFVATSKVHIIEVNGFTGNFYTSSGDYPYPNITMTLYGSDSSGTLSEMICSTNNVITAIYSSELVVGETYKVRLTLNSVESNIRLFNVCVKTPNDLCKIDAVNYDFENPPMQNVTGINTISTQYVVPGWRTNVDTWEAIFFAEALNAINFEPYSGGQCIQLLSDDASSWDPNDPNIKGLYREFDTSEMTKMSYSFAHASRQATGTTMQLYAGPPSGPFTLLEEVYSQSNTWQFYEGSYTIPAGQPVTRFIFRSKENAIGNLLDAANFFADVKVKANSLNSVLDCSQTSTQVEAEGIGEWVAADTNPALTSIVNPTSNVATISGFNTPGVYTYYWRTRYCEEAITITYQGFSEVPSVTSPVTYCTSQTATALTATAPSGYTLHWFTEAVGGTGDTIAPIPSTATEGTTTYYVGLVDNNGCEGSRVAIDVVVNSSITPIVDFTYDSLSYCKSGTNPELNTAPDFTTGGSFTVEPSGLTIDTTSGAITLATSLPGNYVITYNVLPLDCQEAGIATFEIEVSEAVTFAIEDQCNAQLLTLNVVPTNGSDLTTVDYLWEDEYGNTIGNNSNSFNVTDYLNQNSNQLLPTTFNVTVISNGCSVSDSFTVSKNNCKLIPRGVSPNNDGDNDTFDLTGLGAREVVIFNRYGNEVYSFRGLYTNQWNGNSNNGSQLPDGTYFYSISFENGEAITGWVYLIRQY